MLMGREIVREGGTEETKEQIRQVKQVKNKNLLSFGDDDDDDDNDDNNGGSNYNKTNSFRIVSFRESQGMGKADNSKAKEVPIQEKPTKKGVDKEKENAWVQKLKDKIRAKMKEEEGLGSEEGKESKTSSATSKNNIARDDKPTTEEDMREKVKNKIREMKKKSKEVGIAMNGFANTKCYT